MLKDGLMGWDLPADTEVSKVTKRFTKSQAIKECRKLAKKKPTDREQSLAQTEKRLNRMFSETLR